MLLTKNDILRHLKQLAQRLNDCGVEGEILLTGGAAMCLAHSARDATKDVDALYEPKDLINQIVAEIAAAENLPPNWLNDGVKGFLSTDAPSENLMTLTGLKITTVSAEYLLAMKLLSSRSDEHDADDIRFLLRKLEITTTAAAIKILTGFFPENIIPPKSKYMLESCLAEKFEKKDTVAPVKRDAGMSR